MSSIWEQASGVEFCEGSGLTEAVIYRSPTGSESTLRGVFMAGQPGHLVTDGQGRRVPRPAKLDLPITLPNNLIIDQRGGTFLCRGKRYVIVGISYGQTVQQIALQDPAIQQLGRIPNP